MTPEHANVSYQVDPNRYEVPLESWQRRHDVWEGIEKGKFQSATLSDLISAEERTTKCFFNMLAFHIYTFYHYPIDEPVKYAKRHGSRWIITKDGEWAADGAGKVHVRKLTSVGEGLF